MTSTWMLVLWLHTTSAYTVQSSIDSDIARACTVYCYGDLLAAVQLSGIFNDSKTFVDMPMKVDPEVINSAFLTINSSNKAELTNFLETYFDDPGSDLDEYIPIDLQEYPPFLDSISNPILRQWGYELNQLWKVLGRSVNVSVTENPQRHSFLPRNYPMIVPGGRFRESYYWDSWWIVRGLLVCDMITTASDVINNLLDDVENFGFIPNGGRIYYLDRSQPPLLSEMIRSYIDKVGDQSENGLAMLMKAFPLLEIEYDWWMSEEGGHVVSIYSEKDGMSYELNRYHSNSSLPRPESYAEDIETASESARPAEDVYNSLRSGAETGWDFSSRWISGTAKSDLSMIATGDIVPVELNSIMYRFEQNMILFARILDLSDSIIQKFTNASISRANAIDSILWEDDESIGLGGLWSDFNLSSNARQPFGEGKYSISQFIPLWAGLTTGKSIENIVISFFQSGLIQPGGILTTLTDDTGQQWDSPNAWAPLVLMTIEGLIRTLIPVGAFLGANISKAWLNTNYIAYNRTGYMYEKYDAFQVGVGGGGGEYKPQMGFGWTNGVILVLLNTTYQVPPDEDGSDPDDAINLLMIILLSICGSIVFVGIFSFFVFRYMKRFHPKKVVHIKDCWLWCKGLCALPKRSRRDSYTDTSVSPVRPSSEIAGRSGKTTVSGLRTPDMMEYSGEVGSTSDNNLLARIMQSNGDDLSEQSAAYF